MTGFKPSASPLALPVYAVLLGAFFSASSAPTPLYHLYQGSWHFSSTMLTVAFASYALTLLLTLLLTGSLSDYIGRKPVLLVSLLLEVAAMGLFVRAGDINGLIAARALQGIATGMAASSAGAALVDVHPHRGPLVNGLAPLIGMAVGALGSSVLVQYAPAPMALVYWLLAALFAALAVLVVRLPESGQKRAGALASLRPRILVPPAARAMLLQIAPVDIACWALGGFFLSLGPALASSALGSSSALMGGWVVFALTISGVVAIMLTRPLAASRLLVNGAALLAAGLAVTLAAVHLASPVAFFCGTLLAGAGFGMGFQASLRSLLPLASGQERSGLLATFYILSYLAFALPTMLAGAFVQRLGLRPTTDGYGIALIALALLTVVMSLLAQRRAQQIKKSPRPVKA